MDAVNEKTAHLEEPKMLTDLRESFKDRDQHGRPRNADGHTLTKNNKLRIRNICKNLPRTWVGAIDMSCHDQPDSQVTRVIMDWVVGSRVDSKGAFQFKPGREQEQLPTIVLLEGKAVMDHYANLKTAFKDGGAEGIYRYIAIVSHRISFKDVEIIAPDEEI